MPKKNKAEDPIKSTKNTPAAFLTFDELLSELQSRCRKMVFVAIVDDRKDGGVQTIMRRSETCGDTILLLEHAIEFCTANWNYNTFGIANEVDDDDDTHEVG